MFVRVHRKKSRTAHWKDAKHMSGLRMSTLLFVNNSKESLLETTVDRQVINRKLKTGLVRKQKTVK